MRQSGGAGGAGRAEGEGDGGDLVHRSALSKEIRRLAELTGKRTVDRQAVVIGTSRASLYRFFGGEVPSSSTMKRMLKRAVERRIIAPEESAWILKMWKAADAEQARARAASDAVAAPEPASPPASEPTLTPASEPEPGAPGGEAPPGADAPTRSSTAPRAEPTSPQAPGSPTQDPPVPGPGLQTPPRPAPPAPPSRRRRRRWLWALGSVTAVGLGGLGVLAQADVFDDPASTPATSTAVAAEYRAHAAFHRSLQHFVLTDSAEDSDSAVLEFRIDDGPVATRWNKNGSNHRARIVRIPPFPAHVKIEYRVCVAPYQAPIPPKSCGQWTTDLPPSRSRNSELYRAPSPSPSRPTATPPSTPPPADKSLTDPKPGCHWKVIRDMVGVYEDPTRIRPRIKTKTKGKVVGCYCNIYRNTAEGATYVAVKTETATDKVGWINAGALTPTKKPKK